MTLVNNFIVHRQKYRLIIQLTSSFYVPRGITFFIRAHPHIGLHIKNPGQAGV